jgi:hypothetical protein
MFNNAGWVAATLDKIEWSQVWVFGRRQPPERGMKFAPIVELTP